MSAAAAGEAAMMLIGGWIATFAFGLMSFASGDTTVGILLLSIDFGLPLAALIVWCVISISKCLSSSKQSPASRKAESAMKSAFEEAGMQLLADIDQH